MAVKEIRGSQVIHARTLWRYKAPMEQGFAIALWCLSIYGTFLGFGGAASAGALAMALAWQLGCTAVQLITCAEWNPWYIVAVAASVIPSWLGFSGLVATPLAASLTGATPEQFSTPHQLAGDLLLWYAGVQVVIFVAALIADVAPERILVKRG